MLQTFSKRRKQYTRKYQIPVTNVIKPDTVPIIQDPWNLTTLGHNMFIKGLLLNSVYTKTCYLKGAKKMPPMSHFLIPAKIADMSGEHPNN